MSDALKSTLGAIHRMMESADIDHALLTSQPIDVSWLADYSHQRIVNSFLFNYLKIQDKVGRKFFRLALRHWRELESDDVTMLDILHRLEQLRILESVEVWDRLREVRNTLTHDYPEEGDVRLETLALALRGYEEIKAIVARIEERLASG